MELGWWTVRSLGFREVGRWKKDWETKMGQRQEKKSKKRRGDSGIEPETSRTQRENHATRTITLPVVATYQGLIILSLSTLFNNFPSDPFLLSHNFGTEHLDMVLLDMRRRKYP